MGADQLRAALQKKPFRPFTIHTGSGEKYLVRHPEVCSISPGGRTVGVWVDAVDIAIINTDAITEFVTKRKTIK